MILHPMRVAFVCAVFTAIIWIVLLALNAPIWVPVIVNAAVLWSFLKWVVA